MIPHTHRRNVILKTDLPPQTCTPKGIVWDYPDYPAAEK